MRIGIMKNFGSGAGIRLLEDPWVPGLVPRPPFVRDDFDPNAVTLDFLLEQGSDEWKISRLIEAFGPDESKQITKIKPSTREAKELYSWVHQDDGMYTVKSGYHVWFNEVRESDQPQAMRHPSLDKLYEGIWSTRTTPKIKHLLWRIMSNTLPTAETLKKKRLSQSSECPRCGFANEDNNHLFFQCGFARAMWATSPAGFLFLPETESSIYANMAKCLWETKKREGTNSWPWMLWRIWKSRNEFWFNGTTSNPRDLTLIAIKDEEEWIRAQEKGSNGEETRSSETPTTSSSSANTAKAIHRWIPPPPGMFICNVDASWSVGSLGSGTGWVLRSSFGMIRFYGVKTYPVLQSALLAEATALVWACSCLSNMRIENVIFQTDCHNLYAAIKDPGKWPSISASSHDILRVFSQNPSFKLQLISRNANRVADYLAKKAKDSPLYHAEIQCNAPIWMQPLVRGDLVGSP